MKYSPPFGSTDPNKSYQNADPSSGAQGSIPDATGFEATQREIVNTVAAAGLAPSGSDLTQLLQAVRSGRLDYLKDVSTAANALVLVPQAAAQGFNAVPFTALFEGNRFRFKAAFASTGDTVAQISAIANIPVRMAGGSKVTIGSWPAGAMLTMEYDGAVLQVTSVGGGTNSLLQTANVLLTVSGMYPSIRAAMAAASAMFLPIGVFGQIQVTQQGWVENCDVISGPIQLPGQFGERWSLVGPALTGAFPTSADIAGKTNNQALTLLRSRFNCEIRCVGTGAFELRSGVWSQIANILITGDGTNGGGRYGIKVGDWSSRVGMAALGLANVAVHNFGLDNIRAEQTSVIQGVNVLSTYSAAHCFHISHFSVLEINTGSFIGMYGTVGIQLQNGGLLAVDSSSGSGDLSYNAVSGLATFQSGFGHMYPLTSLRITNNGQAGIIMNGVGSLLLPVSGTTVFGGNPTDIILTNGCSLYTQGCGLPGGSSPARGTSGNQGCAVY